MPEGELLLSVLGEVHPLTPSPCIACGWCADVCPTELRPANLYARAARHPDGDLFMADLEWCIDCGLCTHVCPSGLPLAQTFRAVKATHGSHEKSTKSSGATAR